MKTIKVEDTFVSYIKEFVNDRLDAFEYEQHYEIDACDLRWEICDRHSLDDMFDDDEAFDFLHLYPSAALAAIDWAQSCFGTEELPYMFESWAIFAERVVNFGVENIIDRLPLVIERWDDGCIVFDHDTVKLLKEQVAATTFEY